MTQVFSVNCRLMSRWMICIANSPISWKGFTVIHHLGPSMCYYECIQLFVKFNRSSPFCKVDSSIAQSIELLLFI